MGIGSFVSSGGLISSAPAAVQKAVKQVNNVIQQVNSLDSGGGVAADQAAAFNRQMLQQNNSAAAAAGIPQTSGTDLRAVLRALHPADVYDGGVGLLQPLYATNGLIFPYTPTIAFSQAVNYTDIQLVHSNADYPGYARTPTCTLSVTAKFTVQNQTEGQYALAAIHFLRAVSKSYFGELDKGKAGLPPPVLLFSAYGTYVFSKLRCVLKSHSWNFDETMDTVAISVPQIGTSAATTVRLPALFTMQMDLMVVQTPQRMRKKFSFDLFKTGELMGKDDGGFI